MVFQGCWHVEKHVHKASTSRRPVNNACRCGRGARELRCGRVAVRWWRCQSRATITPAPHGHAVRVDSADQHHADRRARDQPEVPGPRRPSARRIAVMSRCVPDAHHGAALDDRGAVEQPAGLAWASAIYGGDLAVAVRTNCVRIGEECSFIAGATSVAAADRSDARGSHSRRDVAHREHGARTGAPDSEALVGGDRRHEPKRQIASELLVMAR